MKEIHGAIFEVTHGRCLKGVFEEFIEESHKGFPKESLGECLKESLEFLKKTLKKLLQQTEEYSLKKFLEHFLDKFRILDFLKKSMDDGLLEEFIDNLPWKPRDAFLVKILEKFQEIKQSVEDVLKELSKGIRV